MSGPRLVWVNHEQIRYEREMEEWRLYRINNSICLHCETQFEPGEVMYFGLADMPVCDVCAEKFFEEDPSLRDRLEFR